MKYVRRPVPAHHRLLAVLVLLHLLAIMAMAASPRLHHWVHHDEDHDDDCAVVLYQHGGCDQPLAAMPLAAVVQAAQPAPDLALGGVAWVPSIFAGNCVFEHGPPAADRSPSPERA